MTDFEHAFDIVMEFEGGDKITNDPRDPGGLTRYGISQSAHPDVDIRNLTEQQAKDIYRREYWTANQCDSLPYPLNLFVFDTAVNMGGNVARKLLQKALMVTQDGVIGPKTLAAARTSSRENWALFMADRAIRYTHFSHFETYGRGWMKRVMLLAMES